MGTEIVTAHSVRLFRPRFARPYDSPLLWFHHLPKDPIVRIFFLSSRADGGDNRSAPPMTRFSHQSGCTRLRLDTFVSRHSLTAIAVRRLPLSPPTLRTSAQSDPIKEPAMPPLPFFGSLPAPLSAPLHRRLPTV